MIVTWKLGENTKEVSEELLDEKIEVTFNQALQFYNSAKQVHDWNLFEKAYGDFNSLRDNPRLLALSTDRHKVVLFETYYHLAEILMVKGLELEAMRYYLRAVQIKEEHKDSWFKMGEIFMAKDGHEFPEGKHKALKCYLKALEVNKCEDNTVIIKRL